MRISSSTPTTATTTTSADWRFEPFLPLPQTPPQDTLPHKPNSDSIVTQRNGVLLLPNDSTETTRRCYRRPLVVMLLHPPNVASFSPLATATAVVATAVSPTLSSPTPNRCEFRTRLRRNDSYFGLSPHRSFTMVALFLLWTVATVILLPYHRFESMVLLTNAFAVGAALPKTPFTTNLFVSNDFTRSASSTATTSSSSSSTSSSSSSSSAPAIITQAGFRPKAERMGIRKRLRSVLENAKRRGGFSSSSSTSLAMSKNTTHNDASLIVAEAASIGGLYESVDFVLANNNNNNSRKNGTTMDTISTLKPVSNGATTKITPSPSNGINNSASGKIETVDVKKNGLTLDKTQEDSDRNGNTGVGVVLQPKVNGSSNVNGNTPKPVTTSKNQVQVDAILNSGTVAPLPFRLPKLTREQKMKLMAGERIQEQSKMGRDGSGYVVLDVKAPDYVVWECLLDFEKYPEYIGTVRSMQMFTNTHLKQSYIAEKPVLPGTGRETRHYGTASITRASFVLSKFLLKIAAVHKYRPHPAGHYMEFTLDKACRNVVLKDAKGIWYTECNPDGRQGYTRIWLLCELSVSRVLPTFIVDYAAKRAMPRASNWIQPVVERVKKEFNIVD